MKGRVTVGRSGRSLLAVFLAALMILSCRPASAILDDSVSVVVNGVNVANGSMMDGVAMVPMAPVFEALGATVTWEAGTGALTARKGDTEVHMTIGSDTATINGNATPLAKAPVLVGGTPMVPVRFAGESLGAKVVWDGATRAVYLWGPEHTGGSVLTAAEHRLAMGENVVLAVRPDGTVWTWGGGKATPVPVPGLTDSVAVSARDHSFLALKRDGTVWRWEQGFYGPQEPVRVEGISDAVAIAAGSTFGLALKGDGTVWAWGDDSVGQLGDGSGKYRQTAGPVPGLAGVRAIAAGRAHALALKSDGTVWAWGRNKMGALGDGTQENRSRPVQVPIAGVVRISAGPDNSFAIRSDGQAWGWGANEGENGHALLNDGDPAVITRPTLLQKAFGSFPDAVRVVGSGTHTVLLQADGTAWGWGCCGLAYFPYLDRQKNEQPNRLLPGLKVVEVAAGGMTTLFLTEKGEVWAGGHLGAGQAGLGALRTFWYYGEALLRLAPEVGVPEVVTARPATGDVRVPTDSAMSLTYDRMIQPGPAFGQIRLQDAAGSEVAVAAHVAGRALVISPAAALKTRTEYRLQVPAGAVTDLDQHPAAGRTLTFTTSETASQVTAVGAGVYHTLAVRDGRVWAWGGNGSRQAGQPDLGAVTEPALVAGLSDVVAVAGSRDGSIALKADGTVWLWGDAGKRRHVDDRGGTQFWEATQKQELPPAQAIAAGDHHFVVLSRDGKVWTWDVRYKDPVEVEGIADVKSVVAGSLTAALKHDGTVWTWYTDQPPAQLPGVKDATAIAIGEGTTVFALRRDGTIIAVDGGSDRRVRALPALPGVKAIASPREFPTMLLALRSDGTVWSLVWKNAPLVWQQVPGLTDVTGLDAGYGHFVARRADGTMWAWGANAYGQLGDGTQIDRAAPVRVDFR
jgi:alpha-tubulin suppressor-like RCC1 family protein